MKSILTCVFFISAILLPILGEAGNYISASPHYFQKLTLSNRPSFESPLHIFADENNRIWLVFDKYVIKKQGSKSTSYPLPGDLSTFLAQESVVRSISAFGTVIISYNNQLIYYDNRLERFINWQHYPKDIDDIDDITGMSVDEKNRLWITTINGVYKLNALDSPWKKVSVPKNLLPEGMPNIVPVSITPIAKNQFIIGDYFSSLYKMTLHDNKVIFEKYDYPDGIVLSSVVKVSDKILIVATSNGLYSFNLVTKSFRKLEGLYSGQSNGKLAFADNFVWMQSNGFLYKRSLREKDFSLITPYIKDKGDSNVVIDFDIDQEGTIWLSVENEGIFNYSKFVNKLEQVSFEGEDNLTNLTFFKIDYNGTPILSRKHRTFLPSQKVNDIIGARHLIDNNLMSYSIIPVTKNSYLVGGKNATRLIDNNNIIKTIDMIKLQESDVTSQGLDNLNRIWLVLTGSGLLKFDLTSGKRLDFNERTKLNYHRVKFVTQHSINRLTLIDNEAIKTLEVRDGKDILINKIKLAQTAIKFERKGNYLFIHHNDFSISRYNLTTLVLEKFNFPQINNIGCVYNNGNDEWWLAQIGGDLHWKNLLTEEHIIYGEGDGIPAGGLSGQWCEAYKDKKYFSTYLGIIRTSEFIENKNKFITNITINTINNYTHQNLYNSSEQLVIIKQKDFPITVDFENNSQVFPSENLHRYQLKGLNDDWINVKDQDLKISYETLPPGEYTLLIQGSNNEGVWGNVSTTGVTVLPIIWLMWWAKLLYLALMSIFLWLSYRLRTTSLRKRATELEKKVQNRTAELLTEKSKVELLLSKKNEEFVNISHELRTPLTLIIGPAKRLLQSDDIAGINKNSIEVIKRNGFRLLRMVDQLLHLEKFRIQQITTSIPVQVKPIAKLIGQSFQELANAKGITLTIKQLDDVWLRFIPDALEKILLNLLSNALKYSVAGDNIELTIIKANNNKVHIIVSDTGIGIAKAQQSVIFGRFNRVLNSQSEHITGAGIGLALVKELVNSHEGMISLESELNQGTVFTIELMEYIPSEKERLEVRYLNRHNAEIVELELESVTEQIQSVRNKFEESPLGNGELVTILVVEDNADMRDYISQELDNNYKVLLASNGKQGLKLATETVPDLIISDVMMPEMDGFTLCKILKSQELTSHIPLILLTARSDRASRLKGWKGQADEYLTKPFDSEELLLRVNNLLSIRDLLKSRFYQKTSQTKTIFSAKNNEASVNESGHRAVEHAHEHWEEHQKIFIEKFKLQLEKNITNPNIKVGEIASDLAMSERQLYRKLKGTLNITPATFLRDFRLEKAQRLIEKGESISNIVFDVGFTSHSYFSRCYRAKYGESPSEYGNKFS